MSTPNLKNLQRREFLRRASAVGIAGTAAPWALSLAGEIGCRLSVMPTCASGTRRLISGTARPCESSRWWQTSKAVLWSFRPGAWLPSKLPRKAVQ